MINYEFPQIKHINDIKNVLEKPEFICIQKDGYQVVNYVYVDKDTFTNPLEAECRGLIFDMDGNLISRRYHKFFNVGERDDVVPDLSKPHVILEKLDGSMVSPFMVNGGIRWATKMGITDVSLQVEEWVADKENILKLCKTACLRDRTLIFEWCSVKNKVVLHYPEDRLILTAIRNNYTGYYKPYEELKYIGKEWGVPVVIQHEINTEMGLDYVLDIVRRQEDTEGVVIRFDNGHMVKIKSEWYLKLHRAKDDIGSESKVLKLINDQGLDDLLPLLTPENKEAVLDFQDKFIKNLIKVGDELQTKFNWDKATSTSRKEFAEKVIGHTHADVLFKMYDGTLVEEALANKISKKLNKPDSIRDLIGTTYTRGLVNE